MSNSENYIVEKVYQITTEVIDLIAEYFYSDSPTMNTPALHKFLARNNLHFNVCTIKNVNIETASVIQEITVLKKILMIFNSCTNPTIIRTPKMSVISFNETCVSFKDDLVSKFESKSNALPKFSLTFEYENDVLKYKKFENAKVEKAVYYSHGDNNEVTEFHSSINTANLDYIRVVHKKNSKINFTQVFSNYASAHKSHYNEHGDMISSNGYEYNIQYNDNNQRTKIEYVFDSSVQEETLYEYDQRGNLIKYSRNFGFDSVKIFQYEFEDDVLSQIYLGNTIILWIQPSTFKDIMFS